jgi:hypothetical protein
LENSIVQLSHSGTQTLTEMRRQHRVVLSLFELSEGERFDRDFRISRFAKT